MRDSMGGMFLQDCYKPICTNGKKRKKRKEDVCQSFFLSQCQQYTITRFPTTTTFFFIVPCYICNSNNSAQTKKFPMNILMPKI